MKKRLIIGIIFIISCLSLIVYNEIKSKNEYNTNIHDVTNSASKTENLTVYLNASFIAGSIPYQNKNYYVIFGDSVQYLVLIDDKKAVEINRYLLDNPENTYKIKGITKEIPKGIEDSGIKFVNNYLDALHSEEDHKHNITVDDFYHYFGYVYLDTYTPSNLLITILIAITGVFGVLIIFSAIIKKVRLL